MRIGRAGIAIVVLAASVTVRAHPGLHDELAAYAAAIARSPGAVELYVGRAVRLRLPGDLREALADLDRAERLRPGDPAIEAERGIVLAGLGCDDEADVALRAVLARGKA